MFKKAILQYCKRTSVVAKFDRMRFREKKCSPPLTPLLPALVPTRLIPAIRAAREEK